MYFHRPQFVSVLRGDLLDGEFLEDLLDVLEVRHVTTCSYDGVLPHGVETLDVLEARKGTIGRCVNQDLVHVIKVYSGKYIPRLSAAIIMPSLYLIPRTLEPVTMGCLRMSVSDQ
jgi:hypothetical protein